MQAASKWSHHKIAAMVVGEWGKEGGGGGEWRAQAAARVPQPCRPPVSCWQVAAAGELLFGWQPLLAWPFYCFLRSLGSAAVPRSHSSLLEEVAAAGGVHRKDACG